MNRLVATKGKVGISALTISLEPSEVDDGLYEDGVITNVGVFGVQLGQRTEERAATGDVHVTDGPLEGRR